MSYLDFRAIKARVTILQVLDHHDLTRTLRRQGETLTGKCPLHQGDRGDSFRVSFDKQCYHCFSCQAHGNQLDLVAALQNCSAKEAAQKLVDWFHLDGDERREPPPRRGEAGRPSAKAQRPEPDRSPPKPVMVPAASPAKPTPPATSPQPPEPRTVPVVHREANKPLGFSLADKLDHTHPYLAARGLDEAAIREFGVGFCNAGTMIARVVIPLHDAKGQLVGYVGRWPGEPPTPETPKYKLPKGFRRSVELFNLHRALKEPPDAPLYLVEGVFDVIHLWQLGLKKVVALMGSSLSPEQEELLFRATPFAPQLVLMFDADDAGRSGAAEALPRLARRTFVRVIQFQEEGRQPEHLTTADIGLLPYALKEEL